MSAAGVRARRLAQARPSAVRRLWSWLSSWRTPRDPLLALAIADEIENHILERAERLMEQGMSECSARREAERRFGSVRRVRRSLAELGHEGGGAPGGREFFASVFADLRHGLRALAHAPGFALAVVFTIGLGVGANVAVFSVTDAVLLRPLPYEDPDELIAVEAYDQESDRTLDRFVIERALAWRAAEPLLDGLVLFGRHDMVRTGVEDPESVAAFAVSGNWLQTLGARPALGRTFAPDESQPGAPATIILGHPIWRDRFGADRDVVGRTIELDRRDYTVIGVMPDGFKFPVLGPAQAWVPMLPDGSIDGVEPLRFASLLGRLPDGVEAASVQERLDALAAGFASGDPQPDGWAVRTRVFDNWRANADVERALWVLTGAVAVMLLIATVNAVNLLLVRATARRHETALRIAIGASRGRLVRQLLTENLVLIAAGGLLAFVLARAVLGSIVGLLPSEVTFFLTSSVVVNGRVLLFALVVTALAGLLLSVVPALRAGTQAHAADIGRASASRSTAWLRNGLVIAEVAMTVAMLIGAGLLVNSFLRLTSVDPGYDPAPLVQISLSLPDAGYPDTAARRAFFDTLGERFAAIPGVAAASLADGVPPGAGFTFGVTPQAEGQEPKELPALFIPQASVDDSFFAALGAPVVAGRSFTAEDTRESGHVIIDREMARFFWGDQSPIGRRFRIDADDEYPWLTVVGMVEDIKLMGQDDRRGSMDLFYPLPRDAARSFMSIVVRTAVDPSTLVPAMRDAVRQLDPDLPIYRLQTGEQALAEVNDEPRFFLLMMSIFAAIALGLALIGTYGVLAFTVRQRRRELGVRVALGARGGQIEAMVLKQGVGLAAAGVLLGLLAAWSLSGVARSLLFGIEPTDPLTFAAVAAIMLACAAAACWVPARRATRVDAVEVLRAE
jgi:putative ABC transport system permease protein